jgi:hypothetical protein
VLFRNRHFVMVATSALTNNSPPPRRNPVLSDHLALPHCELSVAEETHATPSFIIGYRIVCW